MIFMMVILMMPAKELVMVLTMVLTMVLMMVLLLVLLMSLGLMDYLGCHQASRKALSLTHDQDKELATWMAHSLVPDSGKRRRTSDKRIYSTWQMKFYHNRCDVVCPLLTFAPSIIAHTNQSLTNGIRVFFSQCNFSNFLIRDEIKYAI